MQPEWRAEKTPWGGGVYYDPTRVATDRRRMENGDLSWGRGSPPGSVQPQDPGGGAMPIVAPRQMMTNVVSDTAKLSGGGGLSWSPPECRWFWGHFMTVVPCEDQEKRPLASGTVSDDDIRSPCGGGALPPSDPLLLGGSFRLMLQIHQRCLLRDLGRFPRGIRWCWSMGPWLGTLQDGGVHVRIGICDRRLA